MFSALTSTSCPLFTSKVFNDTCVQNDCNERDESSESNSTLNATTDSSAAIYLNDLEYKHNLSDLNKILSLLQSGNDAEVELAKFRVDPSSFTKSSSFVYKLFLCAINAGNDSLIKLIFENQLMNFGDDSQLAYQGFEASIKCGHVEIIDYLLSQGADLSYLSEQKLSVLHLAVQSENTNCLTNLFDRYSTYINTLLMLEDASCGYTPLIFACDNGKASAVKYLLGKGANIDAIGVDGQTALHISISKGHSAVVKVLLDHSPRLMLKKYNNKLPLTRACTFKCYEIVKCIITHDKAFPEIAVKHNSVLTYFACKKDNFQFLTILTVGRRQECFINVKGSTPFHYLCNEGNQKLAAIYLEWYEMCLDEVTVSGLTPLMLAVRGHQFKMVEWLLSKGCDVNLRTSSGHSALDLACLLGYTQIAGRLISEVTLSRESRDNAFLLACLKHHFALAESLIPKKDMRNWTSSPELLARILPKIIASGNKNLIAFFIQQGYLQSTILPISE